MVPFPQAERSAPWMFAAIAFALAAGSLRAQCTTSWQAGDPVAGIDGTVQALTMHDPDGSGPLPPVLVAGGWFRAAGAAIADGLAAYDLQTGTWTPFLGGVGQNEVIRALLSLPNGELVVGGVFSSIGGIPVRNIARWNGATWVPLGSNNTIGGVYALAQLPNGDIVAGGGLATIGGTVAGRVARWDGATWHAMSLGAPNDSVQALAALPNGHVVAGGRFLHNSTALNIAEWDGTAWTPIGPGLGTLTDTVHSVAALPNGRLVAGGSFAVAGPVATPHIAQWDGSSWGTLGAGLDGEVFALAPTPAGGLYAVGLFSASGATALARVALWNGSAWSALGTGIRQAHGPGSGIGYAVAPAPGGDLFVGGSFDEAGGTALRNIARFDGSTWSPVPRGNTAIVATVLSRGDEIVVAGEFDAFGGATANNIARFDGASWAGLGGGTDGPVYHAARLGNGDLVITGSFTTAGSAAVNGLARWDGHSWHALAGFLAAGVAVESLADGSVLLVGTTGGLALAFARWDGNTFTFLPGLSGQVFDLTELPNGDLVAVGTLGSFNFQTNIARFDGTSWSAIGTTIGYWYNSVVSATTLADGDLIVSGDFLTIENTMARNIARWDGVTWHALGDGLDVGANALATLGNGELVAAGGFSRSGATQLAHVARWDGATWLPLGSGVDGGVTAIDVAADGSVLVGGSFSRAGGQIAANLARWQPTCPASVTQLSPPCSNASGPLALTVTTAPWTGGAYAADCRGLATPALAAVLIGLSSPNTPLAALHPTGVPNCSLLASPDAALFLAPNNGVAGFRLAVGSDPAFAGLPLFTQVLQLALTAQGNPLQLSASNAVRAIVGTY